MRKLLLALSLAPTVALADQVTSAEQLPTAGNLIAQGFEIKSAVGAELLFLQKGTTAYGCRLLREDTYRCMKIP